MGVGGIGTQLPPLIQAARSLGPAVLWLSDPMHANTIPTQSGVKTRRFDDILGEGLDAAVDA